MSKSSKRWLQEHNRDRYVNLARSRQLRSRAVFKLEELDQRHKLFRPGQTVVDLGAAPGSWSAYVVEKVRPGGKVIAVDLLDMQPLAGVIFLQADLNDAERLQYCIAELGENSADLVISDMAPNLSGIAAVDQAGGKVIAVDLLDMQPLAGVIFLQADLNDAERLQYCIAELGENSADLVISDMAPNLSGIAAVDQAGSLNLAESAYRVACSVLREKGHFLVKLFQGSDSAAFGKQLAEKFDKVLQVKPRASRANSSELYILAKGYTM